jgi:hypothetical protein
MAYIHTIDAAAGLVTVSGGGGQILEEATESTDRMLSDPRITSKFRILILGDASAPPPSPDETVKLSALVRLLRKRISGRIAIVASNFALTKPANLIALLGTQPTLGNIEGVRAFSNEEEARAWVLGRG